ncbi:MAG: hypothetical protein HYX27_26135 [Acidobacteria bacterium]|nr:hypothetical protein [Acidobacteriota bacterium]
MGAWPGWAKVGQMTTPIDRKMGRAAVEASAATGSSSWKVLANEALTMQVPAETLGQTRWRGLRWVRERCCWRVRRSKDGAPLAENPKAAARQSAITPIPNL